MPKHTIRVAIRVRPLMSGGGESVVATDARGAVVVRGRDGHAFTYPDVVVRGSSQCVAFDALAAPLLARLRDGYSCTLLAYGQTGSGKTHTMFGPTGCLTEAELSKGGGGGAPARWGLFPRVALALLAEAGGGALHASAVEVYQDKAYDLLDARRPLPVGQSAGRMRANEGVTVTGGAMTTYHLSSKAHLGGPPASGGKGGKGKGKAHPGSCRCGRCWKAKNEARAARLKAVREAPRNRGGPRGSRRSSLKVALRGSGTGGGDSYATVGETVRALRGAADVARLAREVEASRVAHGHRLNARSSRSHCLVRLHVARRAAAAAAAGATGSGPATKVRRQAFLFVDLAGSERINRSGAEGQRRTEALEINGSLSALGRVIRCLGKGAGHVPYRDATLTMLLRASFGGRSHTAVVVNVAGEASNADETLCSLAFGKRMSCVSNRATVVAGTDAGAEARGTRAALVRARARLHELEAAGHGGRFGPAADAVGRRSFLDNRAEHAECARAVARLRGARAEASAEGRAADARALGRRIESARAQEDNLRDIMLRQKNIKGFWAEPKQAFVAQEAEVRRLEAQLLLAEGGGGDDAFREGKSRSKK